MKSDANPYFNGARIDTDNDVYSLQDMVYIQTDKYKTSERVLDSGLIFHKPLEWQNYETDYAVQDGIVKHVPGKVSASKMELTKGDHVYCHHFLTDKDNEIMINGEFLYALRYEHIYCIIKDKKVQMINDWNFLKPIEAPEITENGIYIKPEKKYLTRYAIMEHPSEASLELGIKKGDKVYFQKGGDYLIKVEGEYYFRLNDKHLIAVIDESIV